MSETHERPVPPEEEIRTDEEVVDEAADDSFPASDPPSYTGAAAVGPGGTEKPESTGANASEKAGDGADPETR